MKGQPYIIREVEMIHEKVKEIINAFFAKLGLSNRVDDISTVPQKHISPTRIKSLINEVANENELRKEANLKIIKDADVITDSINTLQSYFSKHCVEKAVKDIPDPNCSSKLSLFLRTHFDFLRPSAFLKIIYTIFENVPFLTLVNRRNFSSSNSLI
ncbi:conjugal transfer protein TraA [Orientia tsutsugamushi]|uniref:Conjugal transfer protein TraA n=1 Tax=Orientia tsutsugamushi TaxID=784 RepID=A0A2U3RNE3_ORITS|nr:conjugal transfer TraA domain protein [Orientia tsutsugamushi str. Karp]SPR14700.1 conjugal transfer protein TraA [Orientia tsutsugamushi]